MGSFALRWYTQYPVKIRRWNKPLSEVWFDGSYLTAWPRLAWAPPGISFLIGLVAGATHWSYKAFGNSRFSHITAVDFSQMLPLLFIAVVLGAFSAQLGLILVVGFALGDLLLASHPFASPYHAAQFVSYFAFVLLAVTPSMTAKLMAASLPARVRKIRALYFVLGGIVACAVEGLFGSCLDVRRAYDRTRAMALGRSNTADWSTGIHKQWSKP